MDENKTQPANGERDPDLASDLDTDLDTDLGADLAADLGALRAELDARSERDESHWVDQRRAIRRRLAEESVLEPDGWPRPAWLRPAWAAPALAAVMLAALSLPLWLPPLWLPAARHDIADSRPPVQSTAELLRSVEATLSADPAASLSPAGLLIAELELQYAALQEDELEEPGG